MDGKGRCIDIISNLHSALGPLAARIGAMADDKIKASKLSVNMNATSALRLSQMGETEAVITDKSDKPFGRASVQDLMAAL